MRLFILLFFLLLTFSLSANNLFLLCSDYDIDGNPINTYKNWVINKKGNFMYILFKSNENLKDKYYLRIEKMYNRNNNTFYLYDKFLLNTDSTKNWVANKYTFLKNGNYRFAIYKNNEAYPFDSLFTTLNYPTDVYTDDGYLDTWYYTNTSMLFCDSVYKDELIGVKDSFNLNLNKNINIYIGNEVGKNLRTDRMIGRLYSLIDNNKILYRTDIYYTKYTWQWSNLNLFIDKKGTYLIELYSEDDIFINSRKITIL